MPLELCDLCNDLESPRYFIGENGLRFCAPSEDYYWQRYKNGEVFQVANRYFKFIQVGGRNQLIEITEPEHV
jgi:hypothetical protein